ncbi:aspartyl-tRNA(Asn)/glutamyl-tRNA(Gln) amidotransferase subunit A [Marinobacter pelagius]|uniref:Aspartyl-tRNA(Asn)/glutamyl-tRNA(Gln) amidotransferase subunit A n=1 Tax=Marinobacter pelagius TaxID=379482 RepID=A0A366GVB7_9GAMM|nr:amidase [Marinobacter pelagius]RBP31778.1 aspartyl-tRNA(Asn)/glutamyl-tRNA(Gln) amidotransferase subunit A [Marinobacter pelagius]
MLQNRLLAMPLRELSERLADGMLTGRALVEASIAAYEAYGQYDNSYVHWNPEKALSLAIASDRVRAAGGNTGALMGIPISVKDLYGVPGLPIHAGCARPLPEQWQAAGPLIDALQSQLAPVVGKTHCVEFAFGGLGTNAHWGTPKNPWDTSSHRVPGGSSSGAGVSLINGTASLALGTDTAGSVRVPAAMTGVAGLKTTEGRWPKAQIVPLSRTLDSPGMLAHRVEDLAYAFNALDPKVHRRGSRVPDTPDLADLTFGVPEAFFWENCSPGIAEAIERSLRQLELAGARLVSFELSGLDEIYSVFLKGGVAAPELAAFMKTELPDFIESLDPDVAARLHTAEQLPAWEYIHRRQLINKFSEKAASELARIDALLTPTVTLTPPTVASLSKPEAYVKANMQTLRNTAMGNYLGLCGLSMPAGKDEAGMPVGLQILAGPWQDQRLLAIGQAIEKCLGCWPDILGTPPVR